MNVAFDIIEYKIVALALPLDNNFLFCFEQGYWIVQISLKVEEWEQSVLEGQKVDVHLKVASEVCAMLCLVCSCMQKSIWADW